MCEGRGQAATPTQQYARPLGREGVPQSCVSGQLPKARDCTPWCIERDLALGPSFLFFVQRRVCYGGADLPRDRWTGRGVFVGRRRLRVLAERHVLRGTFLESSFGWRVREGEKDQTRNVYEWGLQIITNTDAERDTIRGRDRDVVV